MAQIELIHRLLIAIGIGLLIGAERERRKAELTKRLCPDHYVATIRICPCP
jgi:hypothetical protein